MQQVSMSDLQDALQYLDPSCSRDDWIKIGMGIKQEFGDTAFSEFDNWSMAGDNYKAKATKSMWQSIKASGGVGIGTVLKMAADNGYVAKKEPLTPDEHQRLQKEFAANAKKREAQEAKELAERQQWQGVIANFSKELLDAHTIKVNSNPYLKNKQVESFGLSCFKSSVIVVFRPNFVTEAIAGGDKVSHFFNNLPKADDRDFSFLHIKRGDLAIPLFDVDKKIWNIQIINASGTKMFLKHGRKSGCFYFIGKSSDNEVLAIAEGYATGASVHMATGWPCAVALDAGNLVSVAKNLNEKIPGKKMVICADDDHATNGNPGVTKANEAAKAVNGLVVVPDFSAVNAEAA